MRRKFAAVGICLLLLAGCGGGNGGNSSPNPPNNGGGGTPASQEYVVVGWGELGMHCIDGKDYSVFAVLPPYNTIHAQVLKRGEPPTHVTSGITVTYEAVADSTGAINSSSSSKTNFWDYVTLLFHASVPPETGLANFQTQGNTPQAMNYNAQSGYYEAVGIPTVPYDDKGIVNAYPTAKLVAKDAAGKTLATTTVVLAVSDEMSCVTCHSSNSNAAAQPLAGWVNNSDPAKDVKLNILRLHDDRVDASPYLAGLSAKGYNYQGKLYDTAVAGTPILCASCHASAALSAPGVTGVRALTADMHSKHAAVVNPATNTTLDNASSPAGSCYLCHPGAKTQCQRGAMHNVACYNCHGNLSAVGDSNRRGWIDLPSCQECHNAGTRYGTTFSSPGVFRTTSDMHFATNSNVPVANASLYRFSTGHGSLYCSACHGSQHAELPSTRSNDNLQAIKLQGYAAKLLECGICHTNPPSTGNQGPHSMHSIGQSWVNEHHQYVESGGYQQCSYCHGSDYKGSPLAAVKVIRTFQIEDGATKTVQPNTTVGCYMCHNGPNGG